MKNSPIQETIDTTHSIWVRSLINTEKTLKTPFVVITQSLYL